MDKVFATAGNFVGNITSIGIKLIAVAVVLQVLFGSAVPFLGLDVIANITKIVASLGSQGLVGLAAVAVLYWSFNKSQTTVYIKENPPSAGFLFQYPPVSAIPCMIVAVLTDCDPTVTHSLTVAAGVIDAKVKSIGNSRAYCDSTFDCYCHIMLSLFQLI